MKIIKLNNKTNKQANCIDYMFIQVIFLLHHYFKLQRVDTLTHHMGTEHKQLQAHSLDQYLSFFPTTSCPPHHPALSFPGPLGECVVPTVWRPAPPHPRDHQRPCHVRPQALRQD